MRRFVAAILCSLALAAATLPSRAAEGAVPPDRDIDDGPYLHRAADGLDAEWVCAGRVERRHFPARAWPLTVPARCGYPQPLRIEAAQAPGTGLPQGRARIAALSDLHGQFGLARRLLQANGIIDAQLRWNYGDGLLVIAGDVFDRGPQVTEAFWLLQQLQQQARAAGGDVLFLLGNHETMTLYGDLRYLNPKYARVAQLLERPYPSLYDDASVIGQWLRQSPVIARVGDTLFLHGGISPEFLERHIAFDEANARYRDSLGTAKAAVRADPRLAPLYDGKTSPVWYRGYFDGRLGTAQVQALLQRIGVERVVVGHTSMAHVSGFHGGRVIAIDSSIKRGESGELLFIEDGRLSRGLLDGSRQPLAEGHAKSEG